MKPSTGTPISLRGALSNASEQIDYCSLQKLDDGNRGLSQEEGIAILRAHVRDFLAQKFNADILNAEIDERFEEAKRLKILFDRCVEDYK